MKLSESTLIKRLNNLTPGAKSAQLGQVIEDLLVNYNALQASHADLLTKYTALLAHMDTANVAGLGAAHSATYGSTVTNGVAIKTLTQR
ncbi:MAG TPA: hypothetical protein VF534_01570 [Paraburkholderia sp.]